ncbi:MAG: hypothetical protein ACR2MQ_03160 [Gemmatimonadaceae bacterium]
MDKTTDRTGHGADEEFRKNPDKSDNDTDNKHASGGRADPATTKTDEPNPPRTTTGIFTAPKFGSAGSGGAELDPGPEAD